MGIGGAPPADIDKSASDILDEVDTAFFIVGSARNGRFLIACDFAWVELEDTASLPDGGAASITTESFTGAAYVGYDLGVGSRAQVDAIVGVRG